MALRGIRPTSLRTHPAPLLVAFAVALGSACTGKRTVGERPNVLLITVDTLRADRLGCYGSLTRRTPNIDRIAKQGTLFLNAATPMPTTRPSHFTILTSLYPRDHGVMSNAAPLPRGITTLPQKFSDARYETAGFTGVALLSTGSGAERGFKTFDAPTKTRHRSAEDVVAAVEEWVISTDRRSPFFLWLHVYDPHIPYAPPPDFRTNPPSELGAEYKGLSRDKITSLAERAGGDVPSWVLDYALAMYGGEVDYVDQQIGRVLDLFRDAGLIDETVIVFTADHGECFENGFYFEHGGCLYDGAVRVPLIVRYPPVFHPGTVDTRQVDLLDIAPTLLAIAGLEVPDSFRGRSLLAPFDDSNRPTFLQHRVYDEKAAAGRTRRRMALRSVAGDPLKQTTANLVAARTPFWKYIASDEMEELYDLKNDPEERVNVAKERPDLLQQLRQQVLEWLEQHPEQLAEPVVDEETKQLLKALGYY